MNIANEIIHTIEKPSILSIRKSEAVNIFAVGLLKGQVLEKHTTVQPALLVVLKGSVLFKISGLQIVLSCLDTYQIPVNTDHDVTGLDAENIFLITKEKL